MPTTPNNKHLRQTEQVHGTKTKKHRRGPLLRFQFSKVVLIWVLCLVGFFAAYMISRNLHPELVDKDLEKSSSSADLSSVADSIDDNEDDDSEPDDPEIPEETTPPQTEPAETTTAAQVVIQSKINPVPESAPVAADYINTCAFVGEANIYYMGQNGLLQPESVYSDTELSLENYVTHYFDFRGTQIKMLSVIRAADCPIYLMFGTEELEKNKPESVSEDFRDMLNSVKAAAPEAQVYVLAIPPVTAAAEKNKKLQNSTIDAYNSLLLKVANEEDVYFIDTNTALKNNDSRLDAANAQEDGIHLNEIGGQKLIDYILCHIPA